MHPSVVTEYMISRSTNSFNYTQQKIFGERASEFLWANHLDGMVSIKTCSDGIASGHSEWRGVEVVHRRTLARHNKNIFELFTVLAWMGGIWSRINRLLPLLSLEPNFDLRDGGSRLSRPASLPLRAGGPAQTLTLELTPLQAECSHGFLNGSGPDVHEA